MYLPAPAAVRPSDAARELHIWLWLDDRALTRALRAHLLRLGFRHAEPYAPADAAPGDVVIATPQALAPAGCAELRRRGLRVVVLCPVVRGPEREAYERAGADEVVPMTVEGAELCAALDRIASRCNAA